MREYRAEIAAGADEAKAHFTMRLEQLGECIEQIEHTLLRVEARRIAEDNILVCCRLNLCAGRGIGNQRNYPCGRTTRKLTLAHRRDPRGESCHGGTHRNRRFDE